VLAHDIAEPVGIPSFVVDPVVVDEMNDLARFSGVPEIERASLVHALNVKATARRAARELERPLGDINLVVAHLGGGISVVAIDHGRMTDVSSALSAGPFTPERAGTVPTLELVDMCFSGDSTRDEIRRKLVGGGGFVAYLGTNSAREVEERISKGDERATVVMDAMLYQVAKEIGAMAAVLKGNVDAVVLTGGLANAEYITSRLASYVDFIAPVVVVPGEDEMEALAEGCLRVLRGEEAALEYPGGTGEGLENA
jgi:butyrate kinase